MKSHRGWILLFLASLLAGLLVFTSRGAARSLSIEMTCPVDQTRFQGSPGGCNNRPGEGDPDLWEYLGMVSCSEPSYPMTCPRCYYTGFRDSFQPGKATKDLAAKILHDRVLKPAQPIDPDCASQFIPLWVRWDLYAQILTLRPDATPENLALAYLLAGTGQRGTGLIELHYPEPRYEPTCIVYAGGKADPAVNYGALEKRCDDILYRVKIGRGGKAPLKLPTEWGRALEDLASAPPKNLPPRDALLAKLLAAEFYMPWGEYPNVRRILEEVRSTSPLPPEEAAVLRSLEERTAREARYIGMAIPLLEQTLKEKMLEPDEKCRLHYWIGEKYWEVGKNREAIATLEPLFAGECADHPFRDSAEECFRKAGGTPPAKAQTGSSGPGR